MLDDSGYQFVAPLAGAAAGEAAASPPPEPEISAIAVLPFADMSPSRDQDYLCEGLAEELISALTHVDGLRVVSRTASFQFRSTGADIREIGRQLGAGTLLEGSVRKANERLRVTVRGWGKRDWVEHDPDYDSLRDDPRFQRLLAKLK